MSNISALAVRNTAGRTFFEETLDMDAAIDKRPKTPPALTVVNALSVFEVATPAVSQPLTTLTTPPSAIPFRDPTSQREALLQTVSIAVLNAHADPETTIKGLLDAQKQVLAVTSS